MKSRKLKENQTDSGISVKEAGRELLAEFGKSGGRPRRPIFSDSVGERDQQ
jgi:hypothetical protein